MHTLTVAHAQQAMLLHSNNNVVNAQQVQTLLANASVTFAQVLYVTRVQTSAANKAQNVCKVTSANVMLCANINAQTQVYARAVRKSAAKFAQNNAANVQAFVAQQNYFVHTATHCIVQHAKHAAQLYLYCIYNNAQSMYMHNNVQISKAQAAAFCTASVAKTMLQNNVVHNVTHNIVHNVRVRTITLSNIVQIKARKQVLSVA